MDRELAIKFGDGKEKEVDELCLQPSMTHYSLYKDENQNSMIGTHKKDELNSKIEIIQLVEIIHSISEVESKHIIPTSHYSNKRCYANDDQKDQQEIRFTNVDFYNNSYKPSHYHEVTWFREPRVVFDTQWRQLQPNFRFVTKFLWQDSSSLIGWWFSSSILRSIVASRLHHTLHIQTWPGLQEILNCRGICRGLIWD